jgi:2-dehydropantoate 2-reductase
VRYLIYGTGAVGGLLGGSLALAGQEVVFLARQARAMDLRAHGLHMSGDVPERTLPHPVTATELDQALTYGLPDLILLTVKAYDVEQAGHVLAAAFDRTPPVVSFLNGIGNEEALASSIGESQVIPATLTTAVQIHDAGELRVERSRGIGLAGLHPMLPALRSELESAGMQVRTYIHPARMKWSKLLTNIVANASSAILDWSAARVYQDPGIARREIQALREAIWAMRKLGFSPVNLPGVPVALLGMGLQLPAAWIRPVLGRMVSRGRGQKKPSLHHDIGRGKSEVAWLNGAVLRVDDPGHPHTPANALLLEAMQRLVADASAAAEFRNQPERLIQLAAQHGVPGMTRYSSLS